MTSDRQTLMSVYRQLGGIQQAGGSNGELARRLREQIADSLLAGETIRVDRTAYGMSPLEDFEE